jgi:hypothetical protein
MEHLPIDPLADDNDDVNTIQYFTWTFNMNYIN